MMWRKKLTSFKKLGKVKQMEVSDVGEEGRETEGGGGRHERGHKRNRRTMDRRTSRRKEEKRQGERKVKEVKDEE